MIHLILHNIKRRAPAAVKSFDLVVHSFTRTLTDRGTTDRQADRQTGRQTDRQTDRQAGRQTDRQTNKQTNRHRWTCSQADKQADRQRVKKTGVDQMEGRWKRSEKRQEWTRWREDGRGRYKDKCREGNKQTAQTKHWQHEVHLSAGDQWGLENYITQGNY